MNSTIVSTPKSPVPTRLKGLLVLIAAALALFASFKVAADVPFLTGDKSLAATIWLGWHEYGWDFVREFRFAQDNWLLFALPVNLALVAAFGVRPELNVLGGYLFLLANVAGCGVLAWRLGARKTAWLLPIALLLVGRYTHEIGLVAHPFSHNSTNAAGVAVLALSLGWLQRRKPLALVAVFGLSVAAAFSDPWFLPAYTLPLLLAAVGGSALSRGRALGFLPLAGTCLAAGIVTQTACFGLLRFIASFGFHPASPALMGANAEALVRSAQALFFGQLWDGFFPSLAALLVLAALTLWAFGKLLRSWNPVELFPLAVIALSLGGIVAAFVVSDTPATPFNGRFLLNALYFVPLLWAVACERSSAGADRVFKIAVAAAGCVLLASNVASNWKTLQAPGLKFNTTECDEFVQFLRQNGLTYGYGGYETTYSNPITAYSNPRITVRPVFFSPYNGFMAKGCGVTFSDFWYRDKAAPASQTEFFVVAKPDGAEAQPVQFYAKELIRQFGPPVRTLEFRGIPVLVWDHPLFDRFIPVDPGVKMGIGLNGNPLNCFGWGPPRETSEGITSERRQVHIRLKVNGPVAGDLELAAEVQAALAPRKKQQTVRVSVNGEKLEEWHFTRSERGVQTLRIPASVAAKDGGKLDVQLDFEDAFLPKKGRGSRLRAMRLFSLQINTLPASAPKGNEVSQMGCRGQCPLLEGLGGKASQCLFAFMPLQGGH